MKKQELKQLSEHMDRQIAKQFDEYRKFDDYVKHEVRHAASQMYKTLSILGTAVAVVLSVGGYFGLPYIVRQKVQTILQEATSREGLSILSNQVVSVVQERVPLMIESQVRESSQKLQIAFDERMSNSAQSAEAKVAIELCKATTGMRELQRDMVKLRSKIGIIDLLVSAKAGNRQSYDLLCKEMNTTNDTAILAKDGVAEIDWRYQQRRYSYRDYRLMLRRPGLTLELDALVDIVHRDHDWNCDGAINELVATREKGFVETLVYAVCTSKRLETVYTAIEGLQTLTGQQFKPLGADEVERWWKTSVTNAAYHSGYEDYYDFSIALKTVMEASDDQCIEWLKRLERMASDHPKLLPAWRLIVCFVLDMSESKRFLDGRKELCDKALSQYEILSTDKEEFAVLKAHYMLCRKFPLSDVRSYVNSVIKENDDFETKAMKSKFFPSSFFEDPAIDWPSRRKPIVGAQPGQNKDNMVARTRGIVSDVESDNCVGFVSVTIRKGRRALLELPFGRNVLASRSRLKSITGCVGGDEMSWITAGQTEIYRYDGGRWNDLKGCDSSDVEIPVGEAIIYYERKSDVVTLISFSGNLRGVR